MALLTSTWIAIGMMVASTAYQQMQTRKMKAQAAAAAEARKGFEIVVEGGMQSIPLVYGRAKIGGTRVWHNTKSSHIIPTGYTPAGKVFDVASSTTQASTFRYFDIIGGWFNRTYTSTNSGYMGTSIDGAKNDFLYFQQVLCLGPINKAVDFVIDDSRFANDPTLAQSVTSIPGIGVKAGFRTEILFDGGQNGMIAANFPDRRDAKFPGIAYASTAIRLNRDDPQFNNAVPSVQYFIEGRKVRKSVGGVLSNTREYTNNPAWCLLDYLLKANDLTFEGKPLHQHGVELSTDVIDLQSFEAAATICDRIVMPAKSVYGNVWQSIDGSTDIRVRNIPLYECNIIIDTAKPVRENVEAILSTMGDARLVWSGGKYKLSLSYPTSNSELVNVPVITDDDLLLGGQVELTWPSASERLNFATVKFSNESENFKEDMVSWPPKQSSTVSKGIGGERFPAANATGDQVTRGILNSYGVWSGSGTGTTMEWKFKPSESGIFGVQLQTEYYGNITIFEGNTQVFTTSVIDNRSTGTGSVNLDSSKIYRIVINAGVQRSTSERGAGAIITKGSAIHWTTREPAYVDFKVIENSATLYNTYKAEDSGVELEASVFLEGCTDYYHALAKAEELVRTSRSAVQVSFKYIVKDKFFESGDIIKLSSPSLALADEDFFIRVNDVKMDGNACEVKGVRFDASQLAWNVDDEEYKVPPNLYSFEVPVVKNLIYVSSSEQVFESAGKLEWEHANCDSLSCYVVYYHSKDDLNSAGEPVYREIGRTTDRFFYLPALTVSSAIFGVRTMTKANRLSRMVITSEIASLINVAGKAKSVDLSTSVPAVFVKLQAGLTSPTTIVFTATPQGYGLPFYRWYLNETEITVGISGNTLTLPGFTDQPVKRVYVRVFDTTFDEQNAPVYSDTFSEDFIEVLSLSEDDSRYVLALSDSSFVIPADSNGNPKNSGLFPITVQSTLYRGIKTITADGYGVDPHGCTATVNSTGRVIITGMTEDYAYINVEAYSGSTITVATINFALVRDGAAQNPRIARLNASRLAFLTPKNSSTPDVSSITMSSLSSGFIAPTYTWYLDGVVEANSTSTYTLNSFPVGSSKVVKLVVTETAPNNASNGAVNGIVREDTMTIFSLKEGDDSIIVNLTDENHSVAADANGSIYNGQLPFTTQLVVARGTSVLSGAGNGVTYSLLGASGVTASISTSGLITVTDITGLSNTITARATVGGVNYDKTLTVVKLKDGAKGNDGSPGDAVDIIFRRSASQPAKPAPSSGIPSGWYTDIDSVPASQNSLWSCVGYKIGASTTYTWDTPVQIEGVNVAEVSVFRRSPTSLTGSPPTGGVYDFSIGTLSSAPVNWSTSIPTGTDPVYTSRAVARTTGGTSTGSLSWSTPVLTYQNGTNGTNGLNGTNGINGANGATGAGTYVLTRSGGGTSSPTSGEFTTISGRTPVTGDIVTVTDTAAGTSQVYKYSGTWVSQVAYISGSLIVQNSITAQQISTSYAYVGQLAASQITTGSASDPRGSVALLGSNNVLGVTRVGATVLPGFSVYDTCGAGTPAMWLSSNSTSTTAAIDLNSSATHTVSAVSSNSSYVAGIFKNSALGKEISLGGAYCAYSGSGKGKIYVLDGNGPFTGFHDGLINTDTATEIGDIVVVKKILYKHDVSNTLAEVELSSKPMQKTAYGVVSSRSKPDNHLEIPYDVWWSMIDSHDLVSVNGLGEGQVNVCGENGNIEAGDFIVTSSIAGKGMRQNDDIVRSCTVAKALEDVTFDNPSEVKMVACIYLAS